ncbi:MAG TPA: hypothetical protein VLY03_08480 [Bacteroidota bacterium]|nr:hypothetical protein [Bacteroidota bacterium]
MIRKIGILLLWCCLICASANAQIIVLYNSKPALVGARETGIGGASTADAYDVTTMYWNPASIAYLQRQSVVMSHLLDQSINTMNENIAFPLMFGKNEGVGIGVSVNHVGQIGNTTNADFHVIQYGYDIAYSREILPALSAGIGVAVRYASSDSARLWGVSSSYGIYYNPSPEISYGMTLGGIGSGILYISNRVKTDLSSQNLPRVLQAAVTMRYPSAPDQTFLTISVANQKTFGETGILYNGGLEAYIFHNLILRTGYLYQLNTIGVPTYGVGIRIGKFQLDYGIVPSKLDNRSYQFSMGIALWNQGENR